MLHHHSRHRITAAASARRCVSGQRAACFACLDAADAYLAAWLLCHAACAGGWHALCESHASVACVVVSVVCASGCRRMQDAAGRCRMLARLVRVVDSVAESPKRRAQARWACAPSTSWTPRRSWSCAPRAALPPPQGLGQGAAPPAPRAAARAGRTRALATRPRRWTRRPRARRQTASCAA